MDDKQLRDEVRRYAKEKREIVEHIEMNNFTMSEIREDVKQDIRKWILARAQCYKKGGLGGADWMYKK